MKIRKLALVLALLLSCSSLNKASALAFKDEPLGEGEIISLDSLFHDTEIHADGRFNQHWFQGVSGPNRDNYRGFIDYRLEAHTPLYNYSGHRGKLVARVEGFGFVDDEIEDDFFDDPLVDLPELFWQDDSEVAGLDTSFVFGKFANRRFFDKDEIAPDPFDIGEIPFFATLANTNTLFNSINAGRDGDNWISIQANGSYGFAFSMKDPDGTGLLNRWGFKQAFAVAELQPFGDNFYGVSELNKNWDFIKSTANGEKKYPGQFNVGLVYGQDDVFRVPEPTGDGQNGYLFYTSLVQNIGKFTPYFRYGFLNSNLGGADFTTNHITTGLVYKANKKNIFATHLLMMNSDGISGPDSQLVHLNFWIHKFTDHLGSTLFVVPRYDMRNANAMSGDNSIMLGFNLHATI